MSIDFDPNPYPGEPISYRVGVRANTLNELFALMTKLDMSDADLPRLENVDRGPEPSDRWFEFTFFSDADKQVLVQFVKDAWALGHSACLYEGSTYFDPAFGIAGWTDVEIHKEAV